MSDHHKECPWHRGETCRCTPVLDRDLRVMLLFAIRYARGRKSMAPSLVDDFRTAYGAVLTVDDLAQVRSEEAAELVGRESDG